MSTDTDHQSIGEVLAALRDEFPDVTISKIRFLESQGLIDPERTPSGYRKFRDGDVARLRWILHQQKDNFLPLKVIKSRLDESGPDALPPDVDGEVASDTGARATATRQTSPARGTKAKGTAKARPKAKAKAKPRKTAARAQKASAAAKPEVPRATTPTFESPMLPLEPDDDDEDLRAFTTGASFTRAELATAAGLSAVQLEELEQYGLVGPAAGSGDRVIFSEDALVVAQLAAEFAGHGIGPRHLRMFRSFAEREAGLYDQVIAPRLRRKNPEARARARDDLVDLARLGRALRAAFLRESAAGLLRD